MARGNSGGGGFERFVLVLALLVPVAVASLTIGQFASTSFAGPAAALQSSSNMQLVVKRPLASEPQAPPTLVAPTLTPAPTSTPAPTATPRPTTYVVQRGDELKNIAAQYRVDIFALIRANNIPNPDSLRVGQELRIPDD